jgi:hypothetical protein
MTMKTAGKPISFSSGVVNRLSSTMLADSFSSSLATDGPQQDTKGKVDAAVERAYRRGFHQGAEAAARLSGTKLEAWLKRVEKWRNNPKTKYRPDGQLQTGPVKVELPPHS